jgi:hypothetical protein
MSKMMKHPGGARPQFGSPNPRVSLAEGSDDLTDETLPSVDLYTAMLRQIIRGPEQEPGPWYLRMFVRNAAK